MKARFSVVAVLSLLACGGDDLVSPRPPRQDSTISRAGIVTTTSSSEKYFVRLKDGASAQDVASGHGVRAHDLSTRRMHFFSAVLSHDELQDLRSDRRVAYIIPVPQAMPAQTQQNAPWQLDRIDQRSKTTDNLYTYQEDGSGQPIFIIDSGIDTLQSEFGGRAHAYFDAYAAVQHIGLPDSSGADCYGPGTAVAAIANGTTYGVAKRAHVYDVRVSRCADTTYSTDAIYEALRHLAADPSLHGGIVNMSIRIPKGADTLQTYHTDSTFEDLIGDLQAKGFAFVVSAGNKNDDACNYMPGDLAPTMGFLNVGASDRDDMISAWAESNFGPCVTLYAPGSWVSTIQIDSMANFAWMAGTSYSAPLVAGAAALYRQTHGSVDGLTDAIIATSTKDSILDSRATNNRLLYLPGLTDHAPSPVITIVSDTVALGDTVRVSASESTDPDGDPLSFSWEWGDAPTADTGRVGSHVYRGVGTYQVSLEARDPAGLKASASHVVVVVPPPAAVFTYSPSTVVVGVTTAFDASASTAPVGDSIASYTWDWGDWQQDTGRVAHHLFSAPGTYSVSLAVKTMVGRTASVTHTLVAQHVTIARASRDSLAVSPGITIPDTLAVIVFNDDNQPVSGVPVTWTPAAGSGTLQVLADTTDSTGMARAIWTVGSSSTNTLVATIGSTTQSVAFHCSTNTTVARTVILTPPYTTLTVMYDTLWLQAAGYNASGFSVIGAPVTWTKSGPANMVVIGNGGVYFNYPYSGTMQATVGGVSSAPLGLTGQRAKVVMQRPPFDSLTVLRDTVWMPATVQNTRNQPLNVSVTWSNGGHANLVRASNGGWYFNNAQYAPAIGQATYASDDTVWLTGRKATITFGALPFTQFTVLMDTVRLHPYVWGARGQLLDSTVTWSAYTNVLAVLSGNRVYFSSPSSGATLYANATGANTDSLRLSAAYGTTSIVRPASTSLRVNKDTIQLSAVVRNVRGELVQEAITWGKQNSTNIYTITSTGRVWFIFTGNGTVTGTARGAQQDTLTLTGIP